jgi:plastocyanin
MKHRIALLVVAALVGAGIFGAVASARTSHATAGNKITVIMTDFHFKITKPAVLKHGVKYTVTETNRGAAAHNFDIQNVKPAGKIIAHGKSQTFTIVFKKAGNYQYVCDVPRHAELGMAGSLKVK